MRVERELMRGAGPAAVLRLLEGGEKYGYEMVGLLEKRSDGVLAMGQSTLYPLLYNLEAKGLVVSRVETAADTGRPRKYYRLTGKGQRRLQRERTQWEALSTALGKLGLIGGAATE
jgi:PadR family transcriptional regulator PadR